MIKKITKKTEPISSGSKHKNMTTRQWKSHLANLEKENLQIQKNIPRYIDEERKEYDRRQNEIDTKFSKGNMSRVLYDTLSKKNKTRKEESIADFTGTIHPDSDNILYTPNPIIKKKDTRSSAIKTKAPTLAKRTTKRK